VNQKNLYILNFNAMKTLFKNIAFFLLIPLLYFGFNISFNYYHIKNTKPTIPKVNYLILGDSHIQGTIDPSYFTNALNYAKSGEPYFVSYWKLKFLIEQPNVALDTVLLGFSHHDISRSKDLSLIGNGSYDQFKRSYSIHHFTKKDSLEIDQYKYFNILFRNLVAYPKFKHYYFQGNYGRIDKDLTKRELYNTPPVKHYHFFNKDKGYDISTSNINYLDSIINLCKSKDIHLLLIAAPVTRDYFENIPSKFISKFDQLKSTYNSQNIKTLDFSQAIAEDSLFADFNHLNGKGSQLFMERNHSLIK